MSVAAEINDIIELESKTPARRVLAKCKEHERKNEKYLIEISLSKTTKILIDKRKYKRKEIDIKELKKKYGVL